MIRREEEVKVTPTYLQWRVLFVERDEETLGHPDGAVAEVVASDTTG